MRPPGSLEAPGQEIIEIDRYSFSKSIDFEGWAESMDLGSQGVREAPGQEIVEIHRYSFSKTIDFEGCAESLDLGSEGGSGGTLAGNGGYSWNLHILSKT